MKRILTLIFGLSVGCTALEAEECITVSRVCVEEGETRWVNGISVTRDCWAWKETYACLTDEGEDVNGCSTLEKDLAESGPGKCEQSELACKESVTDVEGNTYCLSQSQNWNCGQKIDLPAINAEWTGVEEMVREDVDESACTDLNADASCRKGEIVCEGNACRRDYSCGGQEMKGCSALEAAGCTVKTQMKCADDSTECDVKEGEMVCEGDLPNDVVESGSAQVTDSETVNVGRPTPDAALCSKLEEGGKTCEQVSQTCVDRYPTVRKINGISYSAPCWGYERVMRCTQTEPVSGCTGLEKSPDCTIKESVCEETDEAGQCLVTKVTYACGAVEDVVPGDAVLVESSDNVTDTVEVNTCKTLEESQLCRLEERVCVDAQSKSETDTCRKWRLTYVCGTGTEGEDITTNDCEALEVDPQCRKVTEECLGTDASGRCTMTTRTYECGGQTENLPVGEVCDNTLCIAGVCEGVKDETSEDFLEGLAMMEIARQAATYADVGADHIFGGTQSECTVKQLGFSCCKTDTAQTQGAMNNSAFGIALTVGVDAVGETIKTFGSPYVYDLLSSYESTSGLLTALYGEAGTGVYSPSFSYYGVSAGLTSTGSLTLEFSPMGFMATVALEMAADYFSCTDEDRMHVLRSARGLCHYVGSYCEKTSAAGCLEKKESWVCFNSKLAKTVVEQGRKQLGLGWGTPKSPVTRGFSLEEFQSLDFSRMDLTGIIADIAYEAAKNGFEADVETTLVRAEKRMDEALEDKNQYTEVNSITGKCFVGDATGVNAQCQGVSRQLAQKSHLSPGARYLLMDAYGQILRLQTDSIRGQ